MKAADTNLIVRFLVRDDEVQAATVKRLLDDGEVLYINDAVLSELYWVLVHVYEYSKNDFVMALDALLEMRSIRFSDQTVVSAALADYIHFNIGFTDCLIHRLNKHRGLDTFTFDKRASILENMHLLK